MVKILLTVISSLFLLFSASSAGSMLYAGFIPAIPDTVTTFFAETPSPYVPSFKQTILLLDIDKKGKCKKINVENEADSLLVPYLQPYLLSLSSSPAELKKKTIKSIQ